MAEYEKKLVRFPPELAKMIQQYANRKHNGNFNEAVRELTLKGLKA